jgi:hypothetical protein
VPHISLPLTVSIPLKTTNETLAAGQDERTVTKRGQRWGTDGPSLPLKNKHVYGQGLRLGLYGRSLEDVTWVGKFYARCHRPGFTYTYIHAYINSAKRETSLFQDPVFQR